MYLEEVLRYKRQQLNTVLSTVYLNHYIYKYQALTEYTTLILGSSSSTRSLWMMVYKTVSQTR